MKIDKSYVRGIEDDERRRALIEAMLLLAARLGLRTVTEGVESEGAARLLAEMGCDALQGWAIGMPAPAAEVERLLELAKPE